MVQLLEGPITWSPQEAVGILQESGIVGCGGAGFPTYVKYAKPQPTLLVNAAESEPGYYCDKLQLRDEAREMANVFEVLRGLFDMERFVVGAEDVAEPYLGDLEAIAEEEGGFEVRYFESKYKYGQEKALCKVVLDLEIPRDQLPQHQGVIVNNNETLRNIYRALVRGEPVTTKLLHVYGEGCEGVKAFEAPVGTLATDLLELADVNIAEVSDCFLYDGGPILSDRVMDPIGESADAPVRRNTNGFLVVHPDKDRPRNAYYPTEDFEHNSIDMPWAPTEIVDVTESIDRVRVPRTVPFGEPAQVRVRPGDTVERGDDIGLAPSGLGVGLHASIPGEVTSLTPEYVEITR